MKILIVAYDFPPIPSPQSIRWAYLSNELARAGHEVQVLAPEVMGYGPGGLPEPSDSIIVHRVFPGFLSALVNKSRRRRANSTIRSSAHDRTGSAAQPGDVPPLNWKGRLRHRLGAFQTRIILSIMRIPPMKPGLLFFWDERGRRRGVEEIIQRVGSTLMFTDHRAEWKPWARRRIDRILREYSPDVVVTSHEPPSTLELGLHVKRLGFRWIADLGDPVLASYTAPRWIERAKSLENQICRQADGISVTTSAAALRLSVRHGVDCERFTVITQGFDHRFPARYQSGSPIEFDPRLVELLYTGSFYAFRTVGELIRAVQLCPRVRLNIASVVAPEEFMRACVDNPAQFRMLGFLGHQDALAAQRCCDVLVNIANDDPAQVPGKLYEYLGARRPVLHIGGEESDQAWTLVRGTRSGWCVANSSVAIAAKLNDLSHAGRAELPGQNDLLVAPYSWQNLAARTADLCAPGRLA